MYGNALHMASLCIQMPGSRSKTSCLMNGGASCYQTCYEMALLGRTSSILLVYGNYHDCCTASSLLQFNTQTKLNFDSIAEACVCGGISPRRSMGLPIRRIGIGTWAIGGGWGPQSDNDSLEALYVALDVGCVGCQLFVTAPRYGNGHTEKLLAQVLKERGKHATIITKVHPLDYRWAPATCTPINEVFPVEHIREQAEGSLRRLGIECIDCLMLQTWCPTWDNERSWYQVMCFLSDQGKIRT